MTEVVRKPAVFSADDPRLVIVSEPEPVATSPDDASAAAVPAVIAPVKKRLPWGALFWSSLSGLVLMGLGLTVTNLIEDLFARTPLLGMVGLVLALLAGLALLVAVTREVVGLIRLATVDAIRERALQILASDNREQGRALVAELLKLTARIPRLARNRAILADTQADIIDGRDLVLLAERELMGSLDPEARRLVLTASKRVSVVTAISPRAAVDMIFVLVNAVRLVRQLATLYGGRPGLLGVLSLFRRVISHLAVTGGIGLADSVIQQVIGHGIAARLSARLGEGMVNGLLTARLGLLTIELVRPLPFVALPRPALNDLAGSLLRSTERSGETAD